MYGPVRMKYVTYILYQSMIAIICMALSLKMVPENA